MKRTKLRDRILPKYSKGEEIMNMVTHIVGGGIGVLVLLAAVSASQDERLLEGGVMRVLGGSRRQLRLAQASEFAAIGLLAGLVAAIAASVLSGIVATQVFDLPWRPDWAMAALGGALGMLMTLVAGLFATRRVLDAPPSVTLRELQG